MLELRDWKEAEYLRHEQLAHEIWTRRNAIEWRVNIELIIMNGLMLKKAIREAYRRQEDSFVTNVKE